MSRGELSLSSLYLICILAMVLCLSGCRKEEPASAADIVDSSKATNTSTEPALTRAEYANDIDRMDRLTERINRACRGSFVVVLGAGDSAESSGLVSIDYALFDKLSDDGAAVLIAEAIASRSKSLSPSQVQIQANTENNVLQADETVGMYIARTGLSSAGFAEWLKANNSTTGFQKNSVPENMRIVAFMRGYTSERYRIVKKDR